MSERTYLEPNEVEVMICLLKIYSRALEKSDPRQVRREEVPEIFLDGGILDLSGRDSLTSSEDRLLGKLSVVKFRKFGDAEPASLPNFPKCMPVSIVRLPHQRKLGDEKHNKRLLSARIKTGKKWLGYLPRSFNDELIAHMFLQIKEEDRVKTAVQKYYNKNRRLSAYDSSCLKGFSGLSDKQYMKFSRAFYYFAGIRILAPVKAIQLLRKEKAEQDYTTMHRFVATMYRVTKQGDGCIKRAIQVGVVTIRPTEAIANSAQTLLSEGKLLPSIKQFKPPFEVPNSVEDVILIKFGMDKGGGSVKLICSPVNVEHPQSVRHVQPICEFTANDTRENMAAAFFNDNSPGKKDIESVVHRRCMLLHVQINGHTQVAIVQNTNDRHNRRRPHALTKTYGRRTYEPSAEQPPYNFDDRIGKFDFSSVTRINLMYNKREQQFDKLAFVGNQDQVMATLTLKAPIVTPYLPDMTVSIHQYLLAGIFVGDLDFCPTSSGIRARRQGGYACSA